MKTLTHYINEFLVTKKLDKVHNNYDYVPKTKNELTDNIKELLDKGETDLNCIDVSNITDMSYLFSNIQVYKNILIKDIDISEWDVHNVTNMEGMFDECVKFDCDLSNWNVSNVENTSYMFFDCKNFNCDLSSWNVSNVENMEYMFRYCKNFKGKGLENWDVSNVKYMNLMFFDCKKLNVDLSTWNVSNVKRMKRMFDNCTSLKNIPSWYKE